MRTNLRLITPVLFFALFVLSGRVHAQAAFGFRAGVLISKQDFQNGDLNDDITSKLGADLALVADFPIGDGFSISPELHWMQKGAKIEAFNGTVGEISRTFNYLELPLLFKVHFGKDAGIFLLGGPSAGYLLTATDKDQDGQTNDIDLDFYKRTEFGAHLGGGIEVGAFLIDVRYILGLSNIFEDDNSELEITNKSFGAGLSLIF
jgi:Outer membrane protein beta-barrel domain